MLRRVLCGSLACSIGLVLAHGGGAYAAAPHAVQPGESLWSISAANNLTTRTVAAYNGMSEDSLLLVGSTIQVPTVQEGAAALASAGITPATPAAQSAPAPASTSVVPAPGMGHVPSPYGELHLLPGAATAWNSMRAEALSVYGVDLYPGGPASAYRTYEQQSELYQAFLAGNGAPANPPGLSSHESGTAVDLATPEMRSVVDQIGWKYGWSKVHAPGEWWHVDYTGG